MKVVIAFVVLSAVAGASPVFAQEKSSEPSPFVVDKDLAKEGKKVWTSKGCNACHMIGKKFAAPDLNGLYDRRSQEWVKSWLHEPEAMYETDDAAKAMIKEFNGMKMPNLKLTDTQITAVMHYIGSEQKAKK